MFVLKYKLLKRFSLLGLLFLGVGSNFFSQSYFAHCQITEARNYFDFGSTLIPGPGKEAKGGEDAFYADKYLLAVADGVGGWNDIGVDPSLYSKELCQNVKKRWIENSKLQKHHPKQLIIDAANDATAKGSSTLAIVMIDEHKSLLHASYIGDSGQIIYRKTGPEDVWQAVFQSEEQQKAFNFPQQIGTNSDPPESALEFTYQVYNDDIIVVGSDGLLDNLDSQQIIDEIKSLISDTGVLQNPKQAAEQLARQAQIYSKKTVYMSPFAVRARKYGHLQIGGKPDDITAIVAQIKLSGKEAAKPEKQSERASNEKAQDL